MEMEAISYLWGFKKNNKKNPVMSVAFLYSDLF